WTHIGFLTGTTFNSTVGPLLARFDVGVAIFFALSGFLLTRPYVAAILDESRFPDRGSFYGRRLRRIVPAYWVALTATYLWLRPALADAGHALAARDVRPLRRRHRVRRARRMGRSASDAPPAGRCARPPRPAVVARRVRPDGVRVQPDGARRRVEARLVGP